MKRVLIGVAALLLCSVSSSYEGPDPENDNFDTLATRKDIEIYMTMSFEELTAKINGMENAQKEKIQTFTNDSYTPVITI